MTVQHRDDRDGQRRYDSAERQRHATSDAIERCSSTMTPWYPSRRPVSGDSDYEPCSSPRRGQPTFPISSWY
jgi:hypothetical protein